MDSLQGYGEVPASGDFFLATLAYVASFSKRPNHTTVIYGERGGAESSLPVAHPVYQVLSYIFLRILLIANALTQFID